MIYHHSQNLLELSYQLKTPLKYSDEFTFIPFKVTNDDFIIQTPRLFSPFGIQSFAKDQIMISFQNKTNDTKTGEFLDTLKHIYSLIESHYETQGTHTVNEFIKEYKGEPILNAKIKSDTPIFDTQKNRCEDLPLYSYASFILYLPGLWVIKDQVWIQWYVLQVRVENNVRLPEYAFKEVSRPPL